MSAELWKLEWWTDSYSGHVGNFHLAYVEGDDRARVELLDLVCQDESDTAKGGDNYLRRRSFGAWLCRRSRDADAPPDRSYVRGVRAWRMVDGEWRPVEYIVEAPVLHVRWSESPDLDS